MPLEKTLPKRKRTAKIVHPNGKNFWTTQKQFWAWVRSGIIEHTGDNPLKGTIIKVEEFKLVSINHTILNLNNPIHLAEAVKTKGFKR